MTAYERIRAALESLGATRESGGRLISQCPVAGHGQGRGDRNPSLSVTAIEDSALVYCHAGCTTEDVMAAIGLAMTDLFDNRRDTTYEYPGGRKVHRKPNKDFPQSGNYKEDTTLFRSDRLGDTKKVYVVEGEKDVLAAEAVGIKAVCSAMGARKGKPDRFDWTPLKGRDITIVADKDDAGRDHAARIRELVLAAGAQKARIVEVAEGKDLADHISAGRPLTDLVETVPAEETTWEAIDLGPWLSGERVSPEPSIGISRTDGQKLIYPGRERTIFGETEGGKSWFALMCCAVEIRMGRDVVYIHYEEGDPGSTIERLLLLGVTRDQIAKHLRFVAPARPAHSGWLDALLTPPPALVVHDGVNEAMSLHGDEINQTDGAATFRRNIIKPCLAVGAATLSCDHVVKNNEGARGRYSIGSGHKVNVLDGAAILVENIEPFGRGLRGASSIYITKDRPGQLRAHGRPTDIPGKTFMGVMVVDATGNTPDFLAFFPPSDKDSDGPSEAKKKKFGLDEIANMIEDIVAAEPEQFVQSRKLLFGKMRNAGHMFRDEAMRGAADMLVASGRLVEVPGQKNSTGYKAPFSSSRPSTDTTHEKPSSVRPVSSSRTSSPLRGDERDELTDSARPDRPKRTGRTGRTGRTDDSDHENTDSDSHNGANL